MSVRDQEENDIVFNLKALQEKRKSNGQKVWLGGSRANTSSPWQWTDGSDWGWQKWDEWDDGSEPNNLLLEGEDNGENCLELYIDHWIEDRTTTWNDEQCNFNQPFICEENKN